MSAVESPEKNPERKFLFPALLVALHSAGLALFINFRFVDCWDEGFYLMAAQSIKNGLNIYTDFFHPQAPTYPHLLSLLSGSGWSFLYQARVLSGALSVLTMVLVGVSAMRLSALTSGNSLSDNSNYRSGLTALFLYGFSGLFLAWCSISKPLALSQFFLVSGIYLYLRSFGASKRSFTLWLFLSGAALTFSATTRSPLLIPWVVIFLSLFFTRLNSGRIKSLASFLIGSFIAALPTLRSALSNPGMFLYQNIGFHMSRAEEPQFADLVADKFQFLWRTALDPQIAILAFGIIALVWINRHSFKFSACLSEQRWIILLAGGVLCSALFMAYPAHRHYVVQAAPLFVIILGAGYEDILNSLKRRFSFLSKLSTGFIAVVYILGLAPYGWIYLGAEREHELRCEIARMESITDIVKAEAPVGDPILSDYPIYVLLAGADILPRTEFVGFEYKSLKLGADFERMNLPDSAYLDSMIRNSVPGLIIIENNPERWQEIVLEDRYELVYDDRYSKIYGRTHK